MILCWKCRLYNTGIDQLMVLCNILAPRVGPKCAFCWILHGVWTWCLVVIKVICWIKCFSPSLCALKSLGCILKAWECSKLYVPDLGVFPVGALGLVFQFHLDLIHNNPSISWYPSLAHFFCACQMVPIGSLYGSFCQSSFVLHRPHCLVIGFWFLTLFMWVTCKVWRILSKFIAQSNYWEALLILF